MSDIGKLERKLMLQAETELARRRLEERFARPVQEERIVTYSSDHIDAAPLNDTTDLGWLPPPVATWVAEVSRVYQVPRVLPIAAALTAAAAVLQGRVSVRVAQGWEEPLSLYWLVSSPTGTRKSTVLRRSVRAIEYWQAEMAAQVEEEARGKRHKLKRLDAQLAVMRRSKTDPLTEGYNRHKQLLSELEHERDSIEVPVAESLLHGDINPPLIPKVMSRNRQASGIERMAVLQAEGTFLRNLLGRWGAGASQLELVLAASSGEPYSVVRSADNEEGISEVQLRSPHLTMGMLVQPELFDTLAKYASSSNLGLIGRCIMTEIDEPPRKPLLGQSVPDEVQAAYDEWLLGLCQLWVSDDPRDVAEGAAPSVVQLSRVAEWSRWLESAYSTIPCDGKGINNRVLGIVARIVAIVALPARDPGGRGDSGECELSVDPQKIFEIIYLNNISSYAYLDRPARGTEKSIVSRVHGALLGMRDNATIGRNSAKIITKVSVRQLQRQLRDVSIDQLYPALETLDNEGWIEWDERSARRYRGSLRYRSFTVLRYREGAVRQPGDD